MITLKLYRQNDPFRELDSRVLNEGSVTVGRDPSVQWCVYDADCEISRQHFVVDVANDCVRVKDLSTNGVFLGAERRRAPRDEFVTLRARDSVQFGQFMLVMEAANAESEAVS